MKKIVVFGLMIFCLFLIAGCTNTTPKTVEDVTKKIESVSPLITQDALPIQNIMEKTTEAKNETVSEKKNETVIQEKPIKEMKRGAPDPDIQLVIYDENKSLFGTTIFADNHIESRPRIIEVNMLGEIIWEYDVPKEYVSYTNPGFDVEVLENNNVLFVLPRKGVFEVNRNGENVWSYLDPKISHDADRLANGNTVFVYGASDKKADSQVKEVDKDGKIVWSWSAKNYFDKEPYADISEEGWTHTNAVTRLENGNTLLSPRNFDILVEVNPSGQVVRIISNAEFEKQHDPEVQKDGNILMANHAVPNSIMKIDWEGNILWKFVIEDKNAWPVRDVNMLSNDNILITGTDRIMELTPENEIVWGIKLDNREWTKETAPALGFYKAERIAH